MPHANGKIYTTTVNGVRQGVNTDDVSATIGDASHDVKTLCISKRINQAAVFRPRYMGGAIHIGPEEFDTKLKNLTAPSSGDPRIQMKCVKYGIWVPYFYRLDEGYPYYASRLKWNARPCDETQYGDLTHFDGYDHKARFYNPVQSVVCAVGSRIQVVFQESASPESIRATTLFGDNEDAYFGFIVYEYQGDAPVLSGTGAVTPKVYIADYYVIQAATARVVSSDFNAKSGYSYDIIPIVAVYNNGDWEYYSLFIADSVPGRIKKSLFLGNIEFIFFRFSEGNFYPDGNVLESGSSAPVDKTTFCFALMMSSDYNTILATSDTAYTTGLIRPGSIVLTAKFTRSNDGNAFETTFTESNGLVVLRQLYTNILRMYIQVTGNSNKVYEWAQSVAGTLAGWFSFDISFTINTNTSGASEKVKYPAVSWMINS